ncbi:MAG TPA: hypothetical protein PKA74_19315, partial [Bauldia sp.]|nr:hypothetical protein [Bauldia sp.]
MASILDSIRGMMVPIRREGWPFIAAFVFAAFFLGWFWTPLFWIGLILSAWCTYFFRDPPRVTPIDADTTLFYSFNAFRRRGRIATQLDRFGWTVWQSWAHDWLFSDQDKFIVEGVRSDTEQLSRTDTG